MKLPMEKLTEKILGTVMKRKRFLKQLQKRLPMKSKTTTSLPEDDADGDEEVPDAAEDEGPDTEHDSISHSGDDAVGKLFVPIPRL